MLYTAALQKRYAESNIPKVELVQPRSDEAQAIAKPSEAVSLVATSNPTQGPGLIPLIPGSGTTVVAAPPGQPPEKKAGAPTLTWQAFNTVMFAAPRLATEGYIGLAPWDLGSFSKSSHSPFVLTLPYAASLRERALAEHVGRSSVLLGQVIT